MDVRFVQARDNGAACGVVELGLWADVLFRLLIAADKDNSLAADRHGRSERVLGVERIDLASLQYEIRGFRRLCHCRVGDKNARARAPRWNRVDLDIAILLKGL